MKALIWRGPNWMTVDEVGEAVARTWSGKRMAVNPIVGCGHRTYCARGAQNLLPLEEGAEAFAILAKGPTEDIKVFLSA